MASNTALTVVPFCHELGSANSSPVCCSCYWDFTAMVKQCAGNVFPGLTDRHTAIFYFILNLKLKYFRIQNLKKKN